jgi:hypothetical protein
MDFISRARARRHRGVGGRRERLGDLPGRQRLGAGDRRGGCPEDFAIARLRRNDASEVLHRRFRAVDGAMVSVSRARAASVGQFVALSRSAVEPQRAWSEVRALVLTRPRGRFERRRLKRPWRCREQSIALLRIAERRLDGSRDLIRHGGALGLHRRKIECARSPSCPPSACES